MTKCGAISYLYSVHPEHTLAVVSSSTSRRTRAHHMLSMVVSRILRCSRPTSYDMIRFDRKVGRHPICDDCQSGMHRNAIQAVALPRFCLYMSLWSYKPLCTWWRLERRSNDTVGDSR
ncbi:uncharacterized protein LOC134224920 [Armigeres subalbatus]|uniref:uncharacterized protein LOC134224920 n=1 Tax=Armigeres subalbatus TaxID=124917 RepID=UPI002ED50891